MAKDMLAVHTDLTEMRWWSMVPYKFNHNQAVKYSIRPCRSNDLNYGQGNSADFLGERLRQTAISAPLCFEFLVQIQTDSKTMPIEDPAIDWDDTFAPFQPLALMSFPVQDIEDEKHQATCGKLRFQPGQALPAHRPLGEINRTRRAIYGELKQQN